MGDVGKRCMHEWVDEWVNGWMHDGIHDECGRVGGRHTEEEWVSGSRPPGSV